MPAREEPEEWESTFVRWVEGADGHVEPRVFPLTPEDFLDPWIGDKMVQGNPHNEAAVFLYDLLTRRLRSRPDLLVVHDLKHLISRRIGPSPDISVLQGPEIDRRLLNYDVARNGKAPILIIEVISPQDARIRRVDEVDKVQIYERIGVTEYLLLDLPRQANGWRHRFLGYRLDAEGRYRPIEPDRQGRLLSQTTAVLFEATPQGDWIQLFNAETGERLLSSLEEEERANRAEEKVARLEAELKRLRAQHEPE